MTDDRKALEALRLGIMRVAQATQEPAIIKLIPGNADLESAKIDSGWNRLCLEVQAWIEESNSDY